MLQMLSYALNNLEQGYEYATNNPWLMLGAAAGLSLTPPALLTYQRCVKQPLPQELMSEPEYPLELPSVQYASIISPATKLPIQSIVYAYIERIKHSARAEDIALRAEYQIIKSTLSPLEHKQAFQALAEKILNKLDQEYTDESMQEMDQRFSLKK